MRQSYRMQPLATEEEIRADIRKEKAAIMEDLPAIGPLPEIEPIEEYARFTPPYVGFTRNEEKESH